MIAVETRRRGHTDKGRPLFRIVRAAVVVGSDPDPFAEPSIGDAEWFDASDEPLDCVRAAMAAAAKSLLDEADRANRLAELVLSAPLTPESESRS
jgi:hypothetical protein